MLTAEQHRKIQFIELYSRRLVHNTFAGAYRSAFKGRGISFHTIRPYLQGDDIRDIDWNVTARTGEAYTRVYEEDRERTVMLVIDTSASCLFGTQNSQKVDFAVELSTVLAHSATFNNDKVGLIVFSDKIEKYVPARKGRKHVMRLIHDMMNLKPTNQGTDLSLALRTVNRVMKPGTILFLLSDFLLPVDDYIKDITIISKRHDTNVIILSDPLEQSFPSVGMVQLQDVETGETTWIDTHSLAWQREFHQRVQLFDKMRTHTLERANVDRIDIPATGDYIQALIDFFQQKQRRLSR